MIITPYQHNRHPRLRLRLRTSLLALVILLLAGAQVGQAADEALSNAQRQEIDATNSASALVDLAKKFVLQREEAAARECIAKACQKDPSLLTDKKRTSPRSWREFWFSYRAVLQEKALAPDDAAGRVKIANWLHDVHLAGLARKMLKKAIKIDKTLPEAQKLAEAWYLFGGGPFQFNLTYALHNTLWPEKLSDESTDIAPHRNQRLMLLPFTYESGADALKINKSRVKVTADEGRICRVLGIMLIEFGNKSGSYSASSTGSSNKQSQRLQTGSEPLWERIEITQTEDGTTELICWNMTQPASKRDSSDKSPFGKKSPYSKSKRDQSSPRKDRSERKQTRPATGYATFVIQVPQTMQTLEATYNNEVTIKLEADLLDVLSRPVAQIIEEDPGAVVQMLANKVAGDEPIVASAAIGKLALIRNPSAGSPGGLRGRGITQGVSLASDISSLVDRTLLAGLAHAKELVRQTAFDAIVNPDVPLSQTCQTAFHNRTDAALAQSLLEQIERTLSAPPAEEDNLPMHQSRRSTQQSRIQSSAAIMGIDDLPASQASDHLFVALRACLQHPDKKIHTKAVDIALDDGSQQSANCLIDVPQETRAVLIERLSDLDDGLMKAALLRILLAGTAEADRSKMADWLGACDQLAIKLTGEKDPVLKMLESRPPIEAQVKLLELLGRADVSDAAAAKMLNEILIVLSADRPLEPQLRQALLTMSLRQFQLPYYAPVERDSRAKQTADRVVITGDKLSFASSGQERRSQQQQDGSQTFEAVLARLITDPDADAKMIRTASAALLRAGRLGELAQQYHQLPDNKRAPLIRVLSEDKASWAREALPIFLAGRLSDSDPWGAPAAMAALAEIYKATNPKEHWKLNEAIKLGVDLQEVVKLSAVGDDQLARSAMSLIRQLGHLSSAESDQLQSASDSAGRLKVLEKLNKQRSNNFSGTFACKVYLDLQPGQRDTRRSYGATAQQATGITNSLAKPATPMVYSLTNIPLVSSQVLIEQDERRGLRISLAGRNIGETGGKTMRANALRINAAPLLSNALQTAAQQGYPLTQFVDTFVLSESIMCDLNHKQLGTWAGEVTVSNQSAQKSPLQIVGALVVLEPVAPAP